MVRTRAATLIEDLVRQIKHQDIVKSYSTSASDDQGDVTVTLEDGDQVHIRIDITRKET